jgi:hypothetical protein
MTDYFKYLGTETQSTEATPNGPLPILSPLPLTITTSTSSSSAPIAPQTTSVSPFLTETASTPATRANEVFQQTAKDYKKAGVKVIIKRYGK